MAGAIGKVANTLIAVLGGEVRRAPTGRRVPAGSFARANADGTITIDKFDPEKALGGKLMKFGGPIGNFDEHRLIAPPQFINPAQALLDELETLDRTQNGPGAQETFFKEFVRPNRTVVPRPTSKPGGTTGQY